MALAQDPILRVADLRIAFSSGDKTIEAVRGASLEVHPGEVVGIVGESGCGKSTVAFACTGYLAPGGQVTEGQVYFRNRDLMRLPDRELQQLRGREIAMVYQNPLSALNPTMRVGKQVAETVRRHLGLSADLARARVRELFESVHLPNPEMVMERYPHQLSGGQQQRVVIAMGLVGDPSLLIMDEPTTGLDVTTEATILDLVAELKTRIGTAILFVTHNLGVVARICDRVVVMYAGEVVENAPVRELFANPGHPYTRGLLAAVPRIQHAGAPLAAIPGQLPRPGSYPAGCSFGPRCPIARDVCHTEHPPLFAVDGSHYSRCFFWPEAPEALPPADNSTSSMPEPSGARRVLAAHNLRKYYEETVGFLPWNRRKNAVKAVDGVSFDLIEGETLAIVGESGSGKSTIAGTLVGLQEPSAGSLELFDHDLAPTVRARPKEQRRQVQIVFQNPESSLNPARSVFETVARPLQLFGSKVPDAELRSQVVSILKSVNLDETYCDRYPAQLSGGEKQRVGIARAIAANPAAVICDESVSALDVSVQATVLNLLRHLQQERKYSYVFVSHDLAVVRYLAHRVAVMYLGQFVEIGPAQRVFQAPSHPYTESLISAIPEPDPTAVSARIRLEGTVPSAAAPPPGCPFQTRCPRKLGPICEQEMPPWQDAGEGHAIRCHIPLATLGSRTSLTVTGWGDQT
jgi:peptide/nickel transport system ATP-binding protein